MLQRHWLFLSKVAKTFAIFNIRDLGYSALLGVGPLLVIVVIFLFCLFGVHNSKLAILNIGPSTIEVQK